MNPETNNPPPAIPTATALPVRLPRESAKAFAAYQAYLELGPERTIAAVAAKLGKSDKLMWRWSRLHDWAGRIASLNAGMAELERATIEAKVIEKAVAWHELQEAHRRAEWNARCRLLEVAHTLLDRLENDHQANCTPAGVARLVEVAHKLGRLATGMPTDLKESKETVHATLDVNWEAALAKVFRPAAPGSVVDVEVVTPAQPLSAAAAPDAASGGEMMTKRLGDRKEEG